jgi:hypothetical protein
MKDYRGSEIEVGAQVAFNWSGEVRLGVVVGFGKKANRVYVSHGKYDIRHDILIQGEGCAKVSKVKHSSSVVVLTPPNVTGFTLDLTTP